VRLLLARRLDGEGRAWRPARVTLAGVVPSVAVEDQQRRTDTKPQHLDEMTRRPVRQVQVGARDQWAIEVEARQSHGIRFAGRRLDDAGRDRGARSAGPVGRVAL